MINLFDIFIYEWPFNDGVFNGILARDKVLDYGHFVDPGGNVGHFENTVSFRPRITD